MALPGVGQGGPNVGPTDATQQADSAFTFSATNSGDQSSTLSNLENTASSLQSAQNAGVNQMLAGIQSNNPAEMLAGQLAAGQAQAEESALSSEIKDEVELMKQIAQNMAT